MDQLALRLRVKVSSRVLEMSAERAEPPRPPRTAASVLGTVTASATASSSAAQAEYGVFMAAARRRCAAAGDERGLKAARHTYIV